MSIPGLLFITSSTFEILVIESLQSKAVPMSIQEPENVTHNVGIPLVLTIGGSKQAPAIAVSIQKEVIIQLNDPVLRSVAFFMTLKVCLTQHLA